MPGVLNNILGKKLLAEIFMECIVLGFSLYFPVKKTAKNVRRVKF